jgi:PKD repeat protein
LPATDPNTCNNLQITPAVVGGYVCQLGNSNTGAETEQLVYPLQVDSNNALFVYHYAVVLQDPNHSAPEQPNFRIRALDSLGNVIDSICGSYYVQSAANIPGFQSCGTTRWKDWTTVGINLAAYIGHPVSLEFTTADCSQGGHYGYAYLDCYCISMAIQTEFCIGANQVVLTAPLGFTGYLWSNGETTQVATINNPIIGQQVTCQLTTVQNCSLTLTTTLQSTIISPAFVYDANPCNTTLQFTDSSTISNGQIVHWDWNFHDSSPVDTNQNPLHTFPTPGVYNVTLFAYSVAGCVDSITVPVTIVTPPVADFAADTVCLGNMTSFTDLSLVIGDVITTWGWDFGDLATDNVPSPQHTFAAAGNHAVQLVINTAAGCIDTVTHNVVVNANPVIQTAGDQTVCHGDSAQLIASGALTYVWTPCIALSSCTGSSVMAAPDSTTAYTITGTDVNGCSSTAVDSVIVTPLPLVFTPAHPEFCAGGYADVCVTGAQHYSWTPQTGLSNANPDSSCLRITVTTTTIYTVTGYSAEGCSASATFTVTVNPNPTPVIVPDGPIIFCIGGHVNLDAGAGDSLYSWNSNAYTTQTINVIATQTFIVTVTDYNGCTGTSAPLDVIVNPLPVAGITPDAPTICPGDNVILTASGGVDYLWSNTSTTSSITVGGGTYTVTVTDANQCSNTASETVTLNTPPVAVVTPPGPVTICTGNPAVLTANPSGPGYHYQWYSSAGPLANDTNQVYTATTNGSYSAIVTDPAGCTGTSNVVLVTLGAGPTVTITASPTIGCLLNTIYIGYGPQYITLNAIATAGAVHYQWYYLGLPIDTTQSINVTLPGSYSVIAYDANWCPSPEPAVLNPPINVIDIRCGHGLKKILLCHVPEGNPGNPQTLCIGPPAVPPHLSLHRYDCLGPCSLYYRNDNIVEVNNFYVYPHPNPFSNGFNLTILSGETSAIRVNVHDMLGRIVESYNDVTEQTIIGMELNAGIYFAEVIQGSNRQMIQIVKSE